MVAVKELGGQKQLLQNEGETKSKKQNFTSQAQDRKVIEKLTFSIQEVKDLKEESSSILLCRNI